MRFMISVIYSFVILSLSGCSTVHNMNIDTSGSILDLDGKGMLLMSVEFSNELRPAKKAGVDQKIVFLLIETKDKETGRITTHNFRPDESSVFVNDGYAKYAFRMLLPEGDYRLRLAFVEGEYGLGYGLMFLPEPTKAAGLLPLMLDTTVKSGDVSYIGNISAIIKERTNDDELRVSMLSFLKPPYPPQPVDIAAGFQTGTIKVQVIDKYDSEVSWYKDKYQVLRSYDIGKAILPQYNYDDARKWANSSGGLVTHSSYPKPVSDSNKTDTD